MIKDFNYKHKFFIRIFILLIFICFPLIINNNYLFYSYIYYIIFILIQVVIHIYYMYKKITITDNGLEMKIFGNLIYRSVSWKNMEEAQEISNKKTINSTQDFMSKPFSVFIWFAERKNDRFIKIIVTYEEPLFINLKQINNSTELYDILKQKVRFIKS